MIKITVIYESKDINFHIVNSAVNFIFTFIDRTINYQLIDIKENKYELRNINCDLKNIKESLLIIVSTAETTIKFINPYKFIEGIYSIINIDLIPKIKFDTIVLGSGIAGLLAIIELQKQNKTAILVDNKLFGRSFLNEGITEDFPMSNELSTIRLFDNLLSTNQIDILYPIKEKNIKISDKNIKILHDKFEIESTNIIITDTLVPKMLKVQNEELFKDKIIYNISENLECLVNKKVIIIGDYGINYKLPIIKKVAKKVTNISLNNNILTPIKIFDKNGKISAILVKHISGYTKPIKCDTIVYATGYEKDNSIIFKDSNIIKNIDLSSTNLIDLSFQGRNSTYF